MELTIIMFIMFLGLFALTAVAMFSS